MGTIIPENTEHCADILDEAGRQTEMATQRAIDEVTARNAPEMHHLFDGLHCVGDDCGIEIPTPRLAMKKVRCVDCQQARELLQRQYGRG